MVRNRLATALFFAAVYATQAGHDSCSGDILHDSGFDLWCGEELCSWQVEKGEVRQAATWHPDDSGVELVGDEVSISQRSEVQGVACVRFDLVADIELEATVVLEMDLFDDGVIDYSQQLPTAAWQDLSYLVPMPDRFQGIRFRLRKSGGGRAVLAQIRAREEEACDGAPLAQPPVPLGGFCGGEPAGEELPLEGDLCASGVCALSLANGWLWPAVCSGCDETGDCGDGEVCGVESRVEPFLDPYRACVPAASRGLGELCMSDGECATGVCCGGACSDCCAADGRACPDQRTCGQRAVDDVHLVDASQCDPAGGTSAAGAACLVDADCASGRCSGGDPLQVCLEDGRLCDQDPDCPPDGTHDEDEFGTCAPIGVTRGTCD
jgi:hypothetical protein